MSGAVSIEQIVVPVPTDIFVGHEEATFHVGISAVRDTVLRPEQYEAIGILRARVYIDECHYLTNDSRLGNGGETDADDVRSVHFCVLENRGPDRQPLAIGTIRLIIKDGGTELLPVETHFREAFSDAPALINSAEISRYIARNESRSVQHAAMLGLMRALFVYSSENGHRPMYAIVDRPLARLLAMMHIPYQPLSDPKLLDAYHSTNIPVVFDPERVIENALMTFFRDPRENSGLGYFDQTLRISLRGGDEQ